MLGLALLSIVSIVAAAYQPKTIEDYAGYAGYVSKRFARGDTSDSSGWRDCTEMENDGPTIGMVCEGVRAFKVHGNLVDVNYFCEFRFSKVRGGKFHVENEFCQ